jgi:hypothetical protein
MLFYLSSNDSDDYSTIKFSANPPLGANKLKFRINQLSTIASFMITTEDDYIRFKIDNVQNEIHFKNKNKYDNDTLANEITTILTEVGITCKVNEFGTLTLTGTKEFSILDASHRAKLLLGLYHTQLPIRSQNNECVIKSVPYICYGNNLFLRSRISSVACINDSLNRESYQSICYHINEMFMSGFPIVSKIPGQFTTISPSDLSNLEFSLVDFQNVPVVLKAPLNLELEVSFLSFN